MLRKPHGIPEEHGIHGVIAYHHYLVGGDWNHGIWIDWNHFTIHFSRNSWEFDRKSSQLLRSPSFFGGVSSNHQPVIHFPPYILKPGWRRYPFLGHLGPPYRWFLPGNCELPPQQTIRRLGGSRGGCTVSEVSIYHDSHGGSHVDGLFHPIKWRI